MQRERFQNPPDPPGTSRVEQRSLRGIKGVGGKARKVKCDICGQVHASAIDQQKYLNEYCLTWQAYNLLSKADQQRPDAWEDSRVRARTDKRVYRFDSCEEPKCLYDTPSEISPFPEDLDRPRVDRNLRDKGKDGKGKSGGRKKKQRREDSSSERERIRKRDRKRKSSSSTPRPSGSGKRRRVTINIK